MVFFLFIPKFSQTHRPRTCIHHKIFTHSFGGGKASNFSQNHLKSQSSGMNFAFLIEPHKSVFEQNTYRTTCLWRSTQYLIALRTMISCFLLKPFGFARFGGTLKVPPHSAFGTNTFPFSSSRSSSVEKQREK